MPVIVKNLSEVADATLTSHPLAFVSKLLAAADRDECHFVVAHRYTGNAYSTTVYHVEAHHLYRATHRVSVRGWLEAIASERRNIKVLKDKEVMNLQVAAGRRVTQMALA